MEREDIAEMANELNLLASESKEIYIIFFHNRGTIDLTHYHDIYENGNKSLNIYSWMTTKETLEIFNKMKDVIENNRLIGGRANGHVI